MNLRGMTSFLVGYLHVMPSSLYVACLQGIMGVLYKMTWIWLISSCFWENTTYPSPKPTFFYLLSLRAKHWARGGVGGEFPQRHGII